MAFAVSSDTGRNNRNIKHENLKIQIINYLYKKN